jgi:hypothetical protein
MAKEIKKVEKDVVVEPESKAEAVEVSIEHKGTHTVYVQGNTIVFVEGKATVSPEVAELLKEIGVLK